MSPWATVRRGLWSVSTEIVMSEITSRHRHLPNGTAPVRPVRVAVAVAHQRGAQLGHRTVECRGGLALEVLEVGGDVPPQGFGHHFGGGVADPGEVGQSPRGSQLGQTLRRGVLDRVGGVAKGLDLVGLGPLRFEQIGDASEGVGGLH